MTNLRILIVTIPAAIISRLRWTDWRFFYNITIGGILVAGITSNLGAGYYMGKWFGIGIALIMMLAVIVYDKMGLAAAALLAYLMGSTWWVTAYAHSRYENLNPYDLMGIRYYSQESAVKLLLFLVPFLATGFSIEQIRSIGRLLVTIFCVVSLWQIGWEWYWHGCKMVNSCGGALANPSLNDSMVAVSLPIVASVLPFGWAFVIPAALASMVAKSAIGTGICALYAGGKLAGKGRGWMAAGVVALVSILAAGYLTHGDKVFFDSSNRFPMWIFFMQKWSINWHNMASGTGFGTFGVFSRNLQEAFGKNPTDWWVWAHNEYIQTAFECGIPGALLLLWVYFDAAKKLYVRQFIPEFQSLILFGVMMGCQYPLHVAPCCLYAAWIVGIALLKGELPSPVLSN